MTKKTLKTSEILNIYNVLNSAKYTKMDDADKIKAWKICRKLKPIATKFDEDSKDAAEKMKPADNFDEKFQKAREYERLTNEHKPAIDIMTTAEYDEFIKTLKAYNKTVGDAVKEFAEKEVKIEFEPLTEEAFGKMISSNEWTMAQVTTLGDFICE